MKIKDWFDHWLLSIKSHVKEQTYVKYEKTIRLYINTFFGESSLSQIDDKTLLKSISELQEKGLSASTINCVITILKSGLSKAVEEGLIDKNPSDKLKRVSTQESSSDAFTLAEQRKIESYLSTCKHTKLLGIKICLYLGLRIGELLALTWSDIDFNEKTITVSKTIDEKGNVYTPKTQAGIRRLPIPNILVGDLKTLKRTSGTYVIETKGHYTRPRVLRDSYYRMLKKLGVRKLKFHSLRHTFATRAIECGIDVKTLSSLLGHANVTITLNRYAHTQMEQKRKALNRLSKLNNGK